MKITLSAVAAAALALLAGCGGGDLPPGVTEVSVTTYPATVRGAGNTPETQDLLTGGLGRSGIGGAAPAYADPLNPTVAELRRNAIYSNYRGLVDFTAAGGYGVFYGPNVGTDGVATAGEGLIPGREHLAVLDDGSGRKQVTLAV
jgi:hydroxybutyrate-dimer hydrolase